jgi:hypothetical protein
MSNMPNMDAVASREDGWTPGRLGDEMGGLADEG